MLIVTCPWCGQREVTEFGYGGEAHIARPENPEQLSDEEWGDYVFFRKNPRGVHYERWVHTHGCRRWFNAVRHTVTDEFFGSYKPGEAPPTVPVSKG
ncbi:MAG: Sarcosine oxidase subunit delta [Gammaproteobacteria bacterium]|nr:Sarcosine oxidase subunit delta [Gammaproteobacteria bacterium]